MLYKKKKKNLFLEDENCSFLKKKSAFSNNSAFTKKIYPNTQKKSKNTSLL